MTCKIHLYSRSKKKKMSFFPSEIFMKQYYWLSKCKSYCFWMWSMFIRRPDIVFFTLWLNGEVASGGYFHRPVSDGYQSSMLLDVGRGYLFHFLRLQFLGLEMKLWKSVRNSLDWIPFAYSLWAWIMFRVAS